MFVSDSAFTTHVSSTGLLAGTDTVDEGAGVEAVGWCAPPSAPPSSVEAAPDPLEHAVKIAKQMVPIDAHVLPRVMREV